MTFDDMQAALDSVGTAATAQFDASNPGRLTQLIGALQTAEMAAGYLFTEVPYQP